MDENANKLHFKFTVFNSYMRVTDILNILLTHNPAYTSIQKHSIFFSKMWVALKRAGCPGVAFGGYINCTCPASFSTAY